MRLKLRVRRFFCDNSDCKKRTFAEQFPFLLAARARRTGRLTSRLKRVAYEVGAESGGRLLAWLLLLSIEFTDLAAVFGWLLLVAVLVAGVRMVALLYALLDVHLFPVAIIPIVSYASSAIYKLVLVPRFPWLWPQENAVLSFAILVFALAGMAIGIESFVILFHGERRLNNQWY